MVLSVCRVTVRQAARTSAGGGDRLVAGGEREQDLVVDPAVDEGEGHPVAGQPVGIRVRDVLDQPVAAQPGQVL